MFLTLLQVKRALLIQQNSIKWSKTHQMDALNVYVFGANQVTTLYYCRLKEYPGDLLKGLQYHWSQDNNILGNHFNIYSNYKDAVLRKNEWKHCDCLAKGIGFPSNCGWYYRN